VNALSADELLAWSDHTADGWRALLHRHPHALALPSDIRESNTVADVVQHIVAVELRFAERLAERAETPYEQIAKDSVEALFATHDRAIASLRTTLARPGYDWEQVVEFATRSAGVWRVSRRTMFVHALMHGIRHWAQLATLLRHHGIRAEQGGDYLLMGRQ